MGRAKVNIAASDSVNLQASLPETTVFPGGVGAEVGTTASGEFVGEGLISGSPSLPQSTSDSLLALESPPASRSDNAGPSEPAEALAGAEAPEFVEEYWVPSWAEFRTFVMENGNKYVRASYPDAPADLIETIWCGVPVVPHEQARVMTPKGEWLVY